jgi:hypothetical protein
MTTEFYPNLSLASLRVILAAEPGAAVTPELVAGATGSAGDFAAVVEDLNRAHMLDESGELTPLADSYARIWRLHVKQQSDI